MPLRARRLFRASTELLFDLDLDHIARTVVAAVRDMTRADAASVSLLDGGDFVMVAWEGLSEEYARAQRFTAEDGRAIYRGPGQHLLVDLARSPIGDRARFEREGLVKVLALPLTRHGTLIGALNAYLRDPARSFSTVDIDLAHVLAMEASMAISNAWQYAEVVRQRELERAFLASLGTAVFVARPPGVLALANDAARRLIGADLAVGAPIAEVFGRLDERDAETGAPLDRAVLIDALAGAEVAREISLLDLATKQRRVVQVSARPVRDGAGEIIAAVASLHDITAQRHLEEERERFLSIVSHELRTPLTPLKAVAQLLVSRIQRARLEGDLPDLDSFERNLQSIERQVDRMNGLVSDLLSVSRAGRGGPEMEARPFDLATSVRDMVDRYVMATREEGRHRFSVEAPESLVITGDQARVEQMLMNLVGNAVKYSPHGGHVRVTLSRGDASAAIVIADEGIGIAAADLPRLGTAFTRGTGKAATFAGMGIGLHVAKLVAEAHGGSLAIESAGDDRGTTVRVFLPV